METIPIQIYTEATPNPETMKFVLNKILTNQTADFKDEQSAKNSPLASELFGFPYIKSVFIANNFVTITKQPDYEWFDVIPALKEFIKTYALSDKPVLSENFEKPVAAESNEPVSASDEEIIVKVKNILDTYVKPAVEMDGGAIKFKSYKDGIVTVMLQGACSGCPSSSVTLKAGIEGMMQRMVPEVKEVVAEAI